MQSSQGEGVGRESQQVHFAFSSENVHCVVWLENGGGGAAAAAAGFEALY